MTKSKKKTQAFIFNRDHCSCPIFQPMTWGYDGVDTGKEGGGGRRDAIKQWTIIQSDGWPFWFG